MSSASVSSGASTSRKPLVIILAVIGIVAIILGILYMVGGSARSRSFLIAGSHVKGSKGHHLARGGVALVVGIAGPDRRVVRNEVEVQLVSSGGGALRLPRGSGSRKFRDPGSQGRRTGPMVAASAPRGFSKLNLVRASGPSPSSRRST